MGLIHFTKYNPNLFSWKGTLNQHSIARVQSIDKGTSTGKTKVKEVGRSTNDGVVGSKSTTPSVMLGITQKEYGGIDIFKALANKDANTLTLDDFNGAACDMVSYLTDNNDTFLGTKWYANTRLTGFKINIGDPKADIERTFDLVGEKDKILEGDNKYFIWKTKTVESGDLGSGNNVEITVSNPTPTANPDSPTEYMLEVIRYRGSTATKLEVSTDYSYDNGTNTLTVTNCQVDDIIKYAYSASTQGSQTLMTLNDSDPAVISADSVSVYLYVPAAGKPGSSDYVYRLQSASLGVTFDRLDLNEVGNNEIVERSIKTKTVTIDLGRFAINNVIEEILRGKTSTYGIIDIEKIASNLKFVIKVYSDNTKSTFKYGLKATGLSATNLNHKIAVDDYHDVSNTLTGESLTITSVEADLLDS